MSGPGTRPASPRDTEAFYWLMFVGIAKNLLGRHDEAISWLQRSIEANRNNPMSHFMLASALALLNRLEEARAAAHVGFALNPQFTIARVRAALQSDNPVFLAEREVIIEGLRRAGVPEG